MCLAVPAKIIEINGDTAWVDSIGNRWKINTCLLADVKKGDVVLVHAGFAISFVDEDAAKETWKLISEIKTFDRRTENTP